MAMECYCAVLRTAARRMTAQYDAALESVGINLAQFSLLRNIERAAPVSLTELGRRVELDRSTVGRNVRVLQRMGLVGITHGADQREASVELTDRGRDLLQRAVPLWREVQRRIEAKLDATQAAELRNLLQML